MALALRRLLGSSVQKPHVDNNKCDLSLVFERAKSSPAASLDISSSPPSHKIPKQKETLFELIAKGKPQQPIKRLYSCPQLEIVRVEKKKSPENSFLFNNYAITTSKPIDLPEEVLKTVIFEYKGKENQQEAWDNFKMIVKTARCSIIVCANIIISFENNKITAKAITGTAQRKLDAACSTLPSMTYDEVVSLIDSMVVREKIELYSTSMFYYSSVKPLRIKRTEFESIKGKKYRITLVGLIFPYIADDIRKKCESESRVSISSSVVF